MTRAQALEIVKAAARDTRYALSVSAHNEMVGSAEAESSLATLDEALSVLDQEPPTPNGGEMELFGWCGHCDEPWGTHQLGGCTRAAMSQAVLAEREACARWWDDTEARAAEAHAVYQMEAHRRGDVRHAESYNDLPEATKEWDRVLVRWVADQIRQRTPKPKEQG